MKCFKGLPDSVNIIMFCFIFPWNFLPLGKGICPQGLSEWNTQVEYLHGGQDLMSFAEELWVCRRGLGEKTTESGGCEGLNG